MKYLEFVYWLMYGLSIAGCAAYDYLPFEVGMWSVIGVSTLTMTLPIVLLGKKMI